VSEIRDAIILAAGLGTRLQPLTSIRAKPAIPVAGEPLIRRIVRGLVTHAVPNIVVNLHHLPATLTGVLGDGRDLGALIRYSWEPTILGSAGGPRRALPMLAPTFFIVNGDTLIDLDLDALAAAHAASGALVTMALVPNREPLRYGGVILNESSHVTRFIGRGPQAAGSFHFVGVQLASAKAFEALPMGEPVNSVGQAYDRLMASDPRSILGFVTDGDCWDVGTVADYIATSRAVQSREGRGSTSSAIDPSARLEHSIVWDDVSIGARADLEGCIVTDRVRVPPGARYRDVILFDGPDGEIVAIPVNNQRG
jgi:NDP-sugar pyrophosphorylase family protein